MLTKKTRIPARKPAPRKARGKPRKSPTQARSRETVAVILEAAARVLETDGLQGYNTNAIAERAGVSIGSLYQYFPNKDSLTVALIQMFEEELLDAVSAAVGKAEGKPLPEALSEIVRAQYDVHLRRASLHRVLEMEEERLHAFISSQKGSLADLVLDLLSTHRASIHPPLRTATEDILTIARSMIDAALHNGTSPAATQRRVVRALCGYLLWEPD